MSTSTTIAVVVDDELPAAIRREHEAASAAALSALGHALECGRLLAQARQGIAHGGWESFVRDRCGIAPRTASLYQRLHANRERLANRQRVAGLTVREAARLVAEPRVAEPEAVPGPRGDDAGRMRSAILFRIAGGMVRRGFSSLDSRDICNALAVIVARDGAAIAADVQGGGRLLPAWYAAGMRNTAVHPEAGWMIETRPHPSGDPFVHFHAFVPGVDGFSHLVGMKVGVADSCLLAVHQVLACDSSPVHEGMPPHDDPGWIVQHDPPWRAPDEREWNTALFRDEDDYRRRGMGLVGSRRRRKAEVPA
jgi:hypothetical protein